MYSEELKSIAATAKKKNKMLKNTPSKYALSCILGGIYVSFGTMLSYGIGASLEHASSPSYKIAMGLSFGIDFLFIKLPFENQARSAQTSFGCRE